VVLVVPADPSVQAPRLRRILEQALFSRLKARACHLGAPLRAGAGRARAAGPVHPRPGAESARRTD